MSARCSVLGDRISLHLTECREINPHLGRWLIVVERVVMLMLTVTVMLMLMLTVMAMAMAVVVSGHVDWP
jgi:hypothetical protein